MRFCPSRGFRRVPTKKILHSPKSERRDVRRAHGGEKISQPRLALPPRSRILTAQKPLSHAGFYVIARVVAGDASLHALNP
jgi:hypothetical protein